MRKHITGCVITNTKFILYNNYFFNTSASVALGFGIPKHLTNYH